MHKEGAESEEKGTDLKGRIFGACVYLYLNIYQHYLYFINRSEMSKEFELESVNKNPQSNNLNVPRVTNS